MTKKNYEAIAGVFRAHAQCGEECGRESVIGDMADVLQADNPRFDRSRFLSACRGEDSKDSAGRTVRYAR